MSSPMPEATPGDCTKLSHRKDKTNLYLTKAESRHEGLVVVCSTGKYLLVECTPVLLSVQFANCMIKEYGIYLLHRWVSSVTFAWGQLNAKS